MIFYLVSHFWAWWLSAFAVGTATALSVGKRPERRRLAGWLAWFGLAFLAGLPVAYLQLLSGRPGFWLESGLALFAAFIAGAALGALIAGRSLRDHEAWAIGLVPLALLLWGAGALAGRTMEQDLERQAASAAERVGGDPHDLEVAGRDILLPSDAANRAASAKEIARIPGVRRVAEVARLPRSAAKSQEEAAPVKRVSPSGETPAPAPLAEKPREAPPTAAKPAPPTPVVSEKTPPAESDRAKSDAALAALRPTGELDAAACQAALSATLAQEPIQFRRNSASIRRVSTGVLEKVTLFLKRCPQAKVEVRGFDDVGERDNLARQRADRVVDYLIRMGVEPGRLAAGQSRRSKGAEGETRTVEFVVEQRR